MNDQEGESRKEREEGSRKELVYVQPEDYPYYEDEISLADLAGVLVRRKWIIIAGTFLFALLAAGYTFFLPTKFEASSLVEIGQTYTEEGSRKIESSEAVKNRIRALGRAVGWEVAQEIDKEADPEAGLGFSVANDFRVDISDQGNIVSASIEAPRDSMALPFLERVEERLIKNHNRIFSQERMSIKTGINRLEINNSNIDTEIKNLKNRIEEIKRKYEAETEEKENKIQQINNTIDNLNSRKAFLQGRISLLKEEKKDLQDRINTVEQQYNDFLESKINANTESDQQGAVGLMLFNSELQRMRKYRDQLRERLLFGIPEQISELGTEIKEIDSKLANRRADLRLEKKLLTQLEPEMEDKIADVDGKIQEKKNQQEENKFEIQEINSKLENMIDTRVVLDPVYSDNPVSPNLKLFSALGVVLGLFLSIFAAFLLEFWENNRDRILNK